ncbi:MAG: lipopolysaccharide heptosyltransferase II [Nitrospirae bacterium]|nr:lipopolysaccharide heptosyltransferase II [Nitrospirota bacterium]
MEEDIKKNKRILIRGVNWIGDAVLTLPAVKAVRRAFPEARISLLVKPWVADIFKECRDIDEIILYEKRHESIGGRLKLARELRQKKFGKAILLQNAFDAAIIAWLAGIPERIGYARDGRSILLTEAVPFNENIFKKHHLRYYLDLLNEAGIDTPFTHPYIYLTDEERQWARSLINSSPLQIQNSPIIGINPGAAYGSAKRWMPERFAEVIRKIVDELNGRVIIFGGPSEAEIAYEIASLCPDHAKDIMVMAGKTDIRQLASLIAECDAFITNDSGPMHMASALFVPIAAIFGSTDPAATGPFGNGHRIITKNLSCSPCLERACPEGHLKCLSEIRSEDVFNALKEILPKERAVFLDRDGTLIEDKNYLNSFNNLVILPEIREGLKKLKDAGFKLIGITNQSGIARGIVNKGFITESNAFLQKELGIDDFFYCPHHPDEKCNCRKPEPLMLLEAKMKHGIGLKASYMIGDKELDVLLSGKTGVTGILLAKEAPETTSASHVAQNLNQAAEWILERERNNPSASARLKSK